MKLTTDRPHIFSSPVARYVRVRSWFEYHPRSVKHFMHVSVLSMLSFTLLNAGLFTVQNGRTSALTTLNGKSYGLMPIDDAKQVLETAHANAELTVRIANKTVLLNAKQSGVNIDSDKTFSALTDMKGWRRVPLVSAIGNLFRTVKPVYVIDQEALAITLAPHVSEETVTAVNASVEIPVDATKPVTIIPESYGSEISAAVAADQLAAAVRAGDFSVKIKSEKIAPTWSELDMRAFMPVIESARNTSMIIQADGKKILLSKEVLAPMLIIDTSGAALKMTLDSAKLQSYLASQANTFYVAPIATKTVQKDGTEVSRTEGVAGKQLDAAATTLLAVKAFENGLKEVTPAIATLTPQVLVTKTYSNTDTGLYKTIEDFAKTHAGSYRVAAVELNGSGNRSAFYEADTSIITASTYKVFIAYGILQKIENGSLSMDGVTPKGSISYCLEKMIHISDNDCASALQTVLGWAAFDKKLIADGFTSTKLNNSNVGDKQSTARDEMSLLTRLYNHELLNESSTEYLFGLMKNQIYRSGIPAGSRGSVVADKVGFLYALYHDIGIVYSPKSTYALVILTDGAGGWNNVKLLSQLIYDFYNQ